MWFLIKTKNLNGVGNDEEQRYLLNDDSLKFKRNLEFLNAVDITALGTEVHPATPKQEE